MALNCHFLNITKSGSKPILSRDIPMVKGFSLVWTGKEEAIEPLFAVVMGFTLG